MDTYTFDESTTVTPETLEAQAAASASSSDRPIWIALASSALGVMASVPTLLAIMGPVPALKLAWAALLMGLTLGAAGLFVAALATSAVKMLKAGRAVRSAEPRESAPHVSGGQLAFE